MTAEDIDIKLGLYLDGELEAQETLSLEAQIEASPELQDRLERLRRASRELKNFYSDSQIIHAPDESHKDMVVERIVRESTMQARKSAIDRAGPKKKQSGVLIGAIGLAVCAALFLVVRTWMLAEPDASELVEGAHESLASGFYEAEVEMDGALGQLRNFDILGPSLPDPQCIVRVGPGGLLHLRLLDKASQEPLLHLGVDDGRYYLWKKDDEAPQTLSVAEAMEMPAFIVVLPFLDTFKEFTTSLEEGLEHPEALELIGKVKETKNSELWKVRLGGPKTASRARYWFDDDGVLKRVAVGSLSFNINPDAKLDRSDFSVSRIFPNMPAEEDD